MRIAVVLVAVVALGLALALQPVAAQTPTIPPAPRPPTPPATTPPPASAQDSAPSWRLAPLTMEQWFTLGPQARVSTPGGQQAIPGGPVTFTQERRASITLRVAMPQALAAEALRIDDPSGITLTRDRETPTTGTLAASRTDPSARLALTVRAIAATDTGLTATLSGVMLTAGPVTVQAPSSTVVVTVTTALAGLPAAIGFEIAAAPTLGGREVEQAVAALAASRGFKRAVIGPVVAYTDLSAYGGAPVSDNLVVRIEAATRWAPSGKRAEVRMVRFGPTGGL
ncbi:MAG: hypothetical protein HYX97_06640, partial [Chloroflexi bacterium]|nr:hypothetical protein [Chloroflexota bacterium]